MAQYANPHQQQQRNQWGNNQPAPGYNQHPNPPPPIGSFMTGPDGRQWQMTPQGWAPAQDPRMMQPQGYYPPQQQPQYPQQYPQYQPPHQPTQMPVYQPQGQMTPQPTVYQNPNQRSQNRFGGQSSSEVVDVTPAQPQQPQPTAPQGDSNMQHVSNGKTSLRKSMLTAPLFTVLTQTTPFNEANTVKFLDLVSSDCLDELVEVAIEKTVNHERNPKALISDAVLEMIYHKANQKKFVGDLFQPDIKNIYKAFKTHLASVNNRYDLVYVSAINDFLTELVNDTLYPILKTYPIIDSFTEDFNDLLRHLRNNCGAEVEDLFIDNVNGVIQRTMINFDVMEKIETAETEGDVDQPTPMRALIPAPVQIICLNYIRAELGSEANLIKLLGGLTDMVSGPVAYVCTIDKTIYKAFFGDEQVILDLVRD